MKIASLIAVLLCSTWALQAQVTITGKDFFNEVGQYYRAYVYSDEDPREGVSVAGRLGTKGGPQSWDFSQGPTDETWRWDIVPVENGLGGEQFSAAKFAEQMTQSDGSRQWVYMDQVRGAGRRVHGFYSDNDLYDHPTGRFTAPIVDFPDPIRFGDKWSTSLTYTNSILSFPAIITENQTFEADAYGVLVLPGNLGFGDALRVNSLLHVEARVDFERNGNFQPVASQYVRTYYWLRENRGIAVQITSPAADAPPPESLTTATTFYRMFETNHPETEADNSPDPVTDLKVTLGKGQHLLNWTKVANANSYRVEYTSALGDPDSWVALGTTTSNFIVDPDIAGVPRRFYRIISLNEIQ